MADTDNIHAGHRERVKERFRAWGAGGFDRHQLVELLLFFGIPRKDTNELAHRLVERFGSLSALLAAPYEELLAVPGMTPNAATLVMLCRTLQEECQRERYAADRTLNTMDKLANYIINRFIGVENERVLLICLDNSGHVLGDGFLSQGSVHATEINVREALRLALRCNATVVVAAHNHPGGKSIPSAEDVASTAALSEALAMAGVTLQDHLVVSGNSYLSMRQTPLCRSAFKE